MVVIEDVSGGSKLSCKGWSRQPVEWTCEAIQEASTLIPECGCWIWNGTRRGAAGYGGVKVSNKSQVAHRLSWIVHNGEIPVGMKVLHRCDTPPCVNPDHLFLGSQVDNIRDMIGKGRANSFGWQSKGRP